MPKKGKLGQFVDLRGAWKERGGGAFEGGGVDTPMYSMRMVQNLKRNLFFVSKMTRIWWILIWALKSLKNLHFDWSFLSKVYNVWTKKVQRSMTLKSHAKFEEKLTCGLEIDTRNLANFHQNTWKRQNWYFHGILLFKVENAWVTNLQRSYK